MEAGVSTACFYPMETKVAFAYLAENGVKKIEIFINSLSELRDDYIDNILKIKEQYGIEITSIHPFTSGLEHLFFFSDYPNRFSDGLEFYSAYFRAAKKLGAKIFVFHGDFIGSSFPDDKGYQRIREMTEFAAGYSVQLAQENVVRCKSSSPQYLLGMKQAFPEVKFVLDIKQAVRSGHDPLEFVESLGNSIIHLHISDNMEGFDCLPIGKGTMDLAGFFKTMQTIDYKGEAVLELYRDNYREDCEVINSYMGIAYILQNCNTLKTRPIIRHF